MGRKLMHQLVFVAAIPSLSSPPAAVCSSFSTVRRDGCPSVACRRLPRCNGL